MRIAAAVISVLLTSIALAQPYPTKRGIIVEPLANSPAEFAAQVRADLARWAKVVRQAHIRVK